MFLFCKMKKTTEKVKSHQIRNSNLHASKSNRETVHLNRDLIAGILEPMVFSVVSSVNFKDLFGDFTRFLLAVTRPLEKQGKEKG
jgi:hypothetical protein